jgi:quinoprotein glucose dehydrogenase
LKYLFRGMTVRKLLLLAGAIAFAAAIAPFASAQNDWPTYGHDPAGTRYSPLKQIDRRNVTKLTRAWTYHMSSNARSGGRGWEVTPLVAGGVMYLTTAAGRVVALEPETGKEIWGYEVKGGQPAIRGLEFWGGDGQAPAQVFFGTSDGRLIALNAKTGVPVPGFGNEGSVDLKSGASNGFPEARFGLASPPIVYKNVIITGAQVQETPGLGASGDTRAWDVHTGRLVWRFHSVPQPGEPGNETWQGDSWKGRSGTNVWGLFTLDTQRGIVYMPFGEPSADYYGGDRIGANLYGTSLVAADALTGKVKWYFQAVHHDVWDYDLGAPPVLVDVTRDGKKIPAVAQLTKMGLLFILDRVTGKPIYGVEERPVPTDDVLPGDVAWPTQPFPLKPPPLARNSFTRADVAKITPEHQKYCEELLDSDGGLHFGGPFTHYTERPSVIFPGSIGGGNWNPPSYDPGLGYLFVNTQDLGSMNRMVKNAEGARAPWSRQGYKGTGRFWNPETNWPCQQPPWGRLFAVDVNKGEIAWQVPLGITENLPADQQKTGRPNLGGSLATAGGLVFIGATDDSRFRAFDSKTGQELWVEKIDAGAHSAPMTYLGKNGKQYVVVTATGGGFLGDRTNADSVIAFTLP